MLLRAASFFLAGLAALPAFAQPMRDQGTALVALSSFEGSRLLGAFYEVAQTPTFLERD